MKKVLILVSFCVCFISYAQQQAANWYFGENAGINFSPSGALTILNDGQLNTIEGCSSISDINGNLLFYTDGTTVYNQNHVMMQNGGFLLGDESSTQSAIVVPKPRDSNIYYIFTVGSNQNQTGLNYSVVDMTLDGGLGAITQKNINLLPSCSEKISAVLKDCHSEEIWVVTLVNQQSFSEGNTFYAYSISDMGVDHTPVTSSFQLSILGITDARGYLKLSPDGTKLACANAGSGMFLFDFDVQTGIATNPLTLNTAHSLSSSAYGVEFSPDNSKLYVTCSNDMFGSSSNDNPDLHRSVLFQFNLNAEDINASRVIIDERTLFRGGLQLAPNGKIYRALSATYTIGTNYLGVIHNPNASGLAANYQHNAVNLGSGKSTQGLPPFIQSFFNEKIDIIRNGNPDSTLLYLCTGQTYTLSTDPTPGAIYTWTFNGETLAENDHDLLVTQPGLYKLHITLDPDSCDTLDGEAYVEYFDYPAAHNTTLIQCDDDGNPNGITLFNLEQIVETITGNTQNVSVKFYTSLAEAQITGNNTISEIYQNITNPQVIYAAVTNTVSGCTSTAEVTLQVSVTQLENYNITPVCDELGSEDGINTFNLNTIATEILSELPQNIVLAFYETEENALLEINPLTGNYTNVTPYSQIIYVRAEDNNACYGISEVTLTVHELPNIVTDDEALYCLNFFPQTITLNSGIIDDLPSNYYYLWSTGESTSQIAVNTVGAYTVRVFNTNGCYKDRTITVLPSNIATITNIHVVDASQNNTVTVIVSGEGNYEYALNNVNGPYQDSNVFDNIPAGLHTVFVRDKNDCGVVNTQISVIGFPKFFTPNNDGYNDYWQVYGISSEFQSKSTIYIFDRYGKLLKELDPLSIGWDGTYNGHLLPTGDYWFAVTLEDGRTFKNHFTLKR